MNRQPCRSALFLDFDNIYLGLRADSIRAAEEFATAPGKWLQWIEEGFEDTESGEHGTHRSLLVRKCYLNPESFGRYRPYFTRAGFSVVDCPPLTSRGKNSADIYMVMDILDALEHTTRFDQFIIMSGDADFTPVLQRLRAHDRRTAVMVSGLVAPAYRASADLLIEEDEILEVLLPQGEPSRDQVDPGPPARPAPVDNGDLLAAIARRVLEKVEETGGLDAADLPRIFREFPQFTTSSNWLGFYSLRSLTEALVGLRPELDLTHETRWRVLPARAETPNPGQAVPESPPAVGNPGEERATQREIIRHLADLVESSGEPVVMARAAQYLSNRFGPMLLSSRWLGHGSFKGFLASIGDELPFAVDASRQPGYLYLPDRQTLPPSPSSEDSGTLPDTLEAFARQVNRLTDTPRLTPAQYRALFAAIARELTRAPYNLMATSRVVRDRLQDAGLPISRSSINFVLRGLSYVGYPLIRAEEHDHRQIANAFRGNVINLMRQAQAPLSPEEIALLDAWLLAAEGSPGGAFEVNGDEPAPPSEPGIAVPGSDGGSPAGDEARAFQTGVAAAENPSSSDLWDAALPIGSASADLTPDPVPPLDGSADLRPS